MIQADFKLNDKYTNSSNNVDNDYLLLCLVMD